MEDEPRIAAWDAKVDWPLTGLTLVFLAGYAWQVLDTSLGPAAREALDLVLTGIWVLLGLDYLVRLGLARRKLRFVGRHLLDLLVLVLPMFRPLRALRVVTVIGVLNRQLRDDFRGRVPIYVGTTVALVGFVAALAVLEAERSAPDASITTFGEAVWWTITTISTVGYGDRYPVTVEGRLVAATLMVAGIALLGVVTASIARVVRRERAAGGRAGQRGGRGGLHGRRSDPGPARRGARRAADDQRPPRRTGARPGRGDGEPRPGPVSPIRSTVGVGSTGPIRSSAAAMSASVTSACGMSRTLPAMLLARTPASANRRSVPFRSATGISTMLVAASPTDQPRSRRPATSIRALA